MSMAWEVTVEDIEIVLRRNNNTKTQKEIFEIYDKIDCDDVESVVLDYTDFDDQVNAALNEIERQMKENEDID